MAPAAFPVSNGQKPELKEKGRVKDGVYARKTRHLKSCPTALLPLLILFRTGEIREIANALHKEILSLRLAGLLLAQNDPSEEKKTAQHTLKGKGASGKQLSAFIAISPRVKPENLQTSAKLTLEWMKHSTTLGWDYCFMVPDFRWQLFP